MTDPHVLIERAQLRYSSDDEPGIRRRRRGKGFSLQHESGRPIGAATRKRVSSLVITPAWTDVWICSTGVGHVQATGRDGSFGLTTLENQHADVQGDSITFTFSSKGGIDQEVALETFHL